MAEDILSGGTDPAGSGSNVAVTSLPATPAGANLIGKVGIDQTTPGTTNGVQVAAALPAGANNIGKVDVNTAAAATLANVNGSASSVTIQAANASRKGWLAFNDSTAAMYIKFGATASTSSFTVKVPAAGYFEMPKPVYVGIIDAIWDSATGAVRVTELT